MARSVIAAILSVVVIGVLSLATAAPSVAQNQPAAAPAAANAAAGATDSDPANATTGLSDAQLGDLVGRIALYPDDLLALILPASTVPLEIVQAKRFLGEAEGQKDPQPPESLSEPVRNLLNYPDIIDQMNNDLAWTQKLGEAVYDDQQSVMDAVQRFRMMAYSAGNLKSDDKQIVEVTEQTVVIQPAKPDVIYVPRYEPSKVIYVSTYPVWGYWPTPYPVYYYPYPPGYAFARGFFWGATAAWAFNWHNGGIGWGNGWHNHNNININRNTNINVNRNANINHRGGGSGSWNPKQGNGNRPSTRPGDAGFKPNIDNRPASGTNRPGTGSRPGVGAGAGNRPSTGTGNRPGAGSGNSNALAPTTRPATRPTGSSGGQRPSTSAATRPSNNAGLRPSSSTASRSAGSSSSYGGSHSRATSPRTSSYGGMSGRQSSAASHRGSMSRGAGGHGGGGGRRR